MVLRDATFRLAVFLARAIPTARALTRLIARKISLKDGMGGTEGGVYPPEKRATKYFLPKGEGVRSNVGRFAQRT